jgi:PAS domain S-box-containing protein/diguanylate cyclase (GGDEF)-like protein
MGATQLQPEFLRRIIDAAPEGIVVCDAQVQDCPVVYVNAAFEQMTGYPAAELIGSNLRILQAADRDQEGRKRLREAITRGEECRVLLRNYRKNGALIWNEIFLQPLRNVDGVLTHFVAFHRDASGRLKSAERSPEGLPTWMREDRVTGLSSRQWFEELLAREWQIARREARPLTLMYFDIDELGIYNDTFGRSAGDACIRRIAGVISGVFRRGTDVVARWEDGCIAVLVAHVDPVSMSTLIPHAEATVRRVAEMRVHHPRALLQKFVTVTGALATMTPRREEASEERLVAVARRELEQAKRELRGSLAVAPES